MLRNRIAATGSPSILGYGYKTNVEYWEEFVYGKKPINEKLKVFAEYGKKAEAPMIELFSLENPQYKVVRNEELYTHSLHDYIVGIPDAFITTECGDAGFLENKTRTVFNNRELREVEENILIPHYWQMIHYFILMPNAKIGIYNIRIRKWDNKTITKVETIDRELVLDDILYLSEEINYFWNNNVLEKTKPKLRINI